MAISHTVPASLAPFFQEYDIARLDPQVDAATIIERTLRFGTLAELRWLFTEFHYDQIRAWVAAWGRFALPEPHLSFWRLVLEMEDE